MKRLERHMMDQLEHHMMEHKLKNSISWRTNPSRIHHHSQYHRSLGSGSSLVHMKPLERHNLEHSWQLEHKLVHKLVHS